jgi:methylated-DNA-[protein]-cysteine S-methyltransferase
MDDSAGIFARESDYLDRYVQVGTAGGKVISVSFPEVPDEDAGDEHPVLDRIERYLAGVDRVAFDEVDVALTLPTDQGGVLKALRDVPYGEQVSCGELAAMVPGLDPDDDETTQTVRTALANNPIPLVVPDHRVRDGPSAAPPEVEQRLRSVEGL